MLKPLLFLLILSILMVCFRHYFSLLLHGVMAMHDAFSDFLKQVFSASKLGVMMRQLVTLFTLPIVTAGFPALGYWALKRKKMPYFIDIMWVIFIILATVEILTFK